MKAILKSYKPQVVAQILNGVKTIDVCKNKPNIEIPFDVYVYCSMDKKYSYAVKEKHQEIRLIDVALPKPQRNGAMWKRSKNMDTEILGNNVKSGGSISEIITSIMDEWYKQRDDQLIKFLRSKGYRPKDTIEYAEYFKKRLKKKGLCFVFHHIRKDNREICDSDKTYSLDEFLIMDIIPIDKKAEWERSLSKYSYDDVLKITEDAK